LKVRQTLLQLDELRFAKGSPPGTAVKDHQGMPTVAGLVQIDLLAVLVWQDNIREAFPNRRSNLGKVDAKVEGSGHKHSSFTWLRRAYSPAQLDRRMRASEDAQQPHDFLIVPGASRHFNQGLARHLAALDRFMRCNGLLQGKAMRRRMTQKAPFQA